MICWMVSTLLGRDTMIVPEPSHVMSSELYCHLGNWARLRPVTLLISATMVADNWTILLLPMALGMPKIM